MRKPLYNIVIFIFHIITLILLFTLCIHFNVIKLDLLDLILSVQSLPQQLYISFKLNILNTN
mgnify:CR=1 FL=1